MVPFTHFFHAACASPMPDMLPDWYPAKRHPAPPDAPLFDWLCHEGSLTLRLTEAGDQDFRVELLKQAPEPAHDDEAAALGLSPGTLVWTREVLLHTAGAPRVYARSVAPADPPGADRDQPLPRRPAAGQLAKRGPVGTPLALLGWQVAAAGM